MSCRLRNTLKGTIMPEIERQYQVVLHLTRDEYRRLAAVSLYDRISVEKTVMDAIAVDVLNGNNTLYAAICSLISQMEKNAELERTSASLVNVLSTDPTGGIVEDIAMRDATDDRKGL